jgi:biopolymer transport protein ExbD
MKSIIIKPRDSKEFEIAFSLISEFGKDRKQMTLEDDEEISFAFLMNVADSAKEATSKVVMKKTAMKK